MGNMAYCRFQNTLKDLRDCYENMEAEPTGEEEKRARKRLIKLCESIASDYGDGE